jgi:hypothetical protein
MIPAPWRLHAREPASLSLARRAIQVATAHRQAPEAPARSSALARLAAASHRHVVAKRGRIHTPARAGYAAAPWHPSGRTLSGVVLRDAERARAPRALALHAHLGGVARRASASKSSIPRGGVRNIDDSRLRGRVRMPLDCRLGGQAAIGIGGSIGIDGHSSLGSCAAVA